MRKPVRVHGPRPLKELGQHFLQDEEIAADIISSMGLKWEDRALEIGPGRGVLLRFLLKRSHRVTAIELDKRLLKSLQKTFGGHPGLDLQFDDFLAFDLNAYVTEEALDGLFLMLAREEQRIRDDPVARTTELLRRWFGRQE